MSKKILALCFGITLTMPPVFSLYQSIRLDGVGHSIGGAIADRLYCHRRAREGLIDYRECLAIAVNRSAPPSLTTPGGAVGQRSVNSVDYHDVAVVSASADAWLVDREYFDGILVGRP